MRESGGEVSELPTQGMGRLTLVQGCFWGGS